jgi:hypothetical protein
LQISGWGGWESTFALLGKQEVGLCSGRQVGDTVTGVQKERALIVVQSSVRLDLEGLVVAEVTRR